jgi:hypothetical protein
MRPHFFFTSVYFCSADFPGLSSTAYIFFCTLFLVMAMLFFSFIMNTLIFQTYNTYFLPPQDIDQTDKSRKTFE